MLKNKIVVHFRDGTTLKGHSNDFRQNKAEFHLETLKQSIDAGSEFLVSPGVTDSLIDAVLEAGVPILPGVISPSEVMRLMEKGITEMKFDPYWR